MTDVSRQPVADQPVSTVVTEPVVEEPVSLTTPLPPAYLPIDTPIGREYVVGPAGIDYVANGAMQRAEPGQTVSDLPSNAVPWLLESGHITDPTIPVVVPDPDPVPDLTVASGPVPDLGIMQPEPPIPPSPMTAAPDQEG